MERKRLDKIFSGITFFALLSLFSCALFIVEPSAEVDPIAAISTDPEEITFPPVGNPRARTLPSTGDLSDRIATHNEGGEEMLSLDLRGIEITELLKVLSKKLGVNLIPTKRVAGRVNVYLNNITYADVLDVIMLSQGLAYEKKSDNVIMIMTDAEYEALYGEKFNEKKEMKTMKLNFAQPKIVFAALGKLKSNVGKVIVDEITGTVILIDTPDKIKVMSEALKNLDTPMVTEIFELQYAIGVDIKENIDALVTSGTGSVLIDERTNSLIVNDLAGNMNKIRQAIKLLDQETRQVFIEAEILELTLRDRFEWGIDWDKIMKEPSFWGTALMGNFPIALSSATTFGRITTGTLDGDRFQIAINFLNTLGDTKVLSSPRIAVVNNEEAVIMVGQREAYITGTTSQSSDTTVTSDTVEFVDVGVKLRVVPTINRDSFITMKIKPEVSTVQRTIQTGTLADPRSIIPIVSTSEAETTVKVKDGTTIMIAGLRQNEDSVDTLGIPYLSKIPIIGLMFQNRDSDRDQTEIIIFLTPHIISGDDARSWDEKFLKKYPEHLWHENRDYGEPEFKSNSLRRTPQENKGYFEPKPKTPKFNSNSLRRSRKLGR